MDAPLLQPRGLRYAWLCACWAARCGSCPTHPDTTTAAVALVTLFDTGARLTSFNGRADAPYSLGSVFAASVAWFLPHATFRAKQTRICAAYHNCAVVSACGNFVIATRSVPCGFQQLTRRMEVEKLQFATGESVAAFTAPYKHSYVISVACTSDDYILVVHSIEDSYSDAVTDLVAILSPDDLRLCSAVCVPGAREACGLTDCTGVLTRTALHLFRTSSRVASAVITAETDEEFLYVAADVSGHFTVWVHVDVQARGHARVYTCAGTLVRRVHIDALPSIPSSLAASAHGELALICDGVTRTHELWRGNYLEEPAQTALVLMDVKTGAAHVFQVQLPDSLPSFFFRKGVVFARNGVVCCGRSVVLLE